MANNAMDVLSKARGEIGYSRWTDPQQGTKYGRYYAKLTGSSYYGQNGVPYCAMFVSWVFAQVGATCPGLPEAYCPYILSKARNAGAVLSSKQSAKPGDVILFDWGGDGVCDHVGIVEKNFGSYVQTIEGNTSSGTSGSQSNGGVVARRTRSWGTVKAVVRPTYGGSSKPSTSTGTSSSSRIKVDGLWGMDTSGAIQSQLGTVADKIVSSQWTGNKKYLPNCTTGWEFKNDATGSPMVRKLQMGLNKYGNYGLVVDGLMGKATVTAVQKWLRTKCGYVKHVIDGVAGPDTCANVQNAVNAGMFATLK